MKIPKGVDMVSEYVYNNTDGVSEYVIILNPHFINEGVILCQKALWN